MTRDALDLQFKVAERVDAKVRGYVGFATAAFAIAQALALRADVRNALGSWDTVFQVLVVTSAALLLITLASAVWALLPQSEADVPVERLREFLRQAHAGGSEAGTAAVNFMIGQVERRRRTNRERNRRLSVVVWLVALSAFVSVLEIGLAVGVLL
ncbi:MAG: hypothetical protein JWQ48_1901 [Conexibacter sp.]|nr:hypothetical protein [Conexibacter sp.]